MKKLTRGLLIAVILIVMVVLPASAKNGGFAVPDDVAAAINAGKADQVYIIQMVDDPVVAYEGGINGLKPTRAPEGQKINPNDNNVKKYADYLRGRHNNALKAVGADPNKAKIYDYVYSLNGFAAVLTPQQAAAMAGRSDVLTTWADELRVKTTDSSPEFLGLTDGTGGLWADLGLDGEDVIIGVIDTGAWPEHPSFSDQDDLADRPGSSGKNHRVYGPPPAGWHGTCQSGELWSQDDCNNKLIGARYFLDGFGHHGLIHDEYKSARDSDGHGTHTASTAGGNANVPVTLLGEDRGTISGMAPRARIAVYKALWNDEGGYSSDLAAAIDAAVADGVDVINYSIGSSSSSFLGPDDIAFLFAADAGVFVATSAGNSGPGASTVGSPAGDPWVTTVGASTQTRFFEGSATTGDGVAYFGASVTGGTGVLPLVDSADAGSELCFPGELDPAVVSGKVVLCLRGVNARVDKSLAVSMAGGAGMILYNPNDAQALVTDNHWVPSVHINFTDGSAIKSYIASEGASATASIGAGSPISDGDAPYMADFSSRGPHGSAPDILKPDVTAPGVQILAGNTPTPYSGSPGELFQAISGTSMSSPHVAGIAALLVEAHPGWTPEMVKSALMTTAYQNVTKEDKSTPADPFDFGAGHIQPNSAVDPGLVYPADFFDYLAFLCGSSSAVGPGTCGVLAGWGYSFDPSDLNLPSMTIADLAYTQTITRRVTNVGPSATTYTPTANVPGVDVTFNPASLTINPGQTKFFEATFTVNGAPLNTWTFGDVTWSDGTYDVRSPVSVYPVPLAAPAEKFGTGDTGSLSYDVIFGYSGPFTASADGLLEADTLNDTVVDDPASDINVALGTGVGINEYVVTIPGGTTYARFSLFDDYTDGNDDLDLYVFNSGGYLVGSSGGGTSAEEVNLVAPAADDYYVIVHGWQTDGPDANFTLFTWLTDGTDAGNLTITAPAAAVSGTTDTIQLDWSGLAVGMKYLGLVHYSDGSDIGFTVVRIDTD